MEGSVGAARPRRSPALYVAIAGCLLVLAGLGWYLVQANRSSAAGKATSLAGALPASLAGQSRTSLATGSQALGEIESLHGKGFDLVGGEIARYGDTTVWVARARDEQGAVQMAELMRARIAEGRSPFRPTAPRQVQGHTVYVLSGMGQSHFYWQTGAAVTWLAIAPERAEQGLRELLSALDAR